MLARKILPMMVIVHGAFVEYARQEHGQEKIGHAFYENDPLAMRSDANNMLKLYVNQAPSSM